MIKHLQSFIFFCRLRFPHLTMADLGLLFLVLSLLSCSLTYSIIRQDEADRKRTYFCDTFYVDVP